MKRGGWALFEKFLNMLGISRPAKDMGRRLGAKALASYPAPVFEISPDLVVLPCNPAARHMARLIDVASAPSILSLVDRARSSRHSLIELAIFPQPFSDLYYELTALPLIDDAVTLIAKDVTLEHNLRSTLVESRQRYKDLIELSSDFIWEIDENGFFAFVSPKGAIGYSPDQLIARPVTDFLAENEGELGLYPFSSREPVEDAEIWMRRNDGDVACLLTSSSPLVDRQGVRRGARGVCRDITEQKKKDLALQRANNRDRLLTYIMRMVRDVVDPSDMLKAAAESLARALRASGCEIFRCKDGKFFLAATFGQVGDHHPVIEALPGGELHDMLVRSKRALAITSHYRREINGALIVWRDESEPKWDDDNSLLLQDSSDQIGIANQQIANHERILNLSRTDSLTGLFNRRAFFEELARRFARLAWDKKPASLVYLDLDNFKLVNDLFGHRRGDEALSAVRDLLLKHSRPTDLVARLGGDEFAVWLEGADETIARKRCNEMLLASHAFAHFSGDVDNPLTMSMGLAVYDPDRQETLQDLLARADGAMYEAKRRGKANYQIAPPPPGDEA